MEKKQITAAKELYADQIEINTNLYSQDKKNRINILKKVRLMAKFAKAKGLRVHCGHGLDYHNIVPILNINEIEGFSIGFSIIARSVMTGLKYAVKDMKKIINYYKHNGGK
jgi:pyridoxine 5-phosphate synthase